MRHPAEVQYKMFRHDQDNPFVCFYCGEPASTMDHQPPISRVYDYRAMGLQYECYVKVPCCEQCNSLLGATLTLDLIERQAVLKRRLEDKYHRVLDTPPWKPGEPRAKLVGRLREHVENHRKRREWIQARLDYAGGINAYLDAVESDSGPFRLVSW